MDVKLPKLGEGADSGTVVAVLVREGDHVKQAQPLIELENEKAVAPIPAPVSGTITKIHARVGQTMSVGQILLSLDPAAASARPAAAAKSTLPPAPVTAPPRESGAAPPPAVESPSIERATSSPEESEPAAAPAAFAPATSPSIRKMARELGLDLTRIRGSERGGRIVLEDVRT
jgi:pyruvate dehydrogenase E2 component (dihydrolipoamide acetyltransferase)